MMFSRCLSLIWLGSVLSLSADEPGPAITGLSISNGQKEVTFELFPAAESYKFLKTEHLGGPWAEDPSGTLWGGTWTAPFAGPIGFYQLEVTPMDRNVLLTTTLLNRMAYGPTPDERERVRWLTPQGFIAEQLAPENIQEELAVDAEASSETAWQYVSVTGSGSSSTLYIYMNSKGDGFIDDLSLVAGTNAGVGSNLIRNGGFEAPLSTNDWTVSANHSASFITTEAAHSGTSSLKLVASTGGTTRDSSIWQTITPSLSSSKQYTLSFWFLPNPTKPRSVTVRLSGSGIVANTSGSLMSQLTRGEGTLTALRSWHIRHAIESRKQLLEVLLQFLENHFVTEYSKSSDYFDQFYNGSDVGQLATQLEFREIQRWRKALLNPECRFYDLLKISAESPAMIIYLDTVTSRGDGRNVANENYARELLELFTFGVDNGYDQNDIVEISKAWTGWRVELVDATNEFSPLAPRLVDLHPNVNVTNLAGVWAFKYRSDRHNNGVKTIFPGKTVPERFGGPYAGKPYELNIAARSGTNGIQDGYDILKHLANQPFTQEFMAVKLCRLFVHDNFATGYDFTDAKLSAEGRLVRECMNAWEMTGGNIRAVLLTLFNSELFQGHAASLQKVKTPLEFTVSALRALRAAKTDGSYSVESDGNLGDILNRMGSMKLFDRAEPDGYPESAPPWISAGTLAERLRFVQALLIARGGSGRTDAGNSFVDPVALLKLKLPATEWGKAEAVADYFLGIIYPAEGRANLALYRSSALKFLNTGDNGVTSSLFSSLSQTSATYDNRVRGMVAMLLTFPRFQEQ